MFCNASQLFGLHMIQVFNKTISNLSGFIQWRHGRCPPNLSQKCVQLNRLTAITAISYFSNNIKLHLFFNKPNIFLLKICFKTSINLSIKRGRNFSDFARGKLEFETWKTHLFNFIDLKTSSNFYSAQIQIYKTH